MSRFLNHLDFDTQDPSDSLLRFFEDCFDGSQPQYSEDTSLSSLLDPTSPPPSHTPPVMSHFDSVFPMPIFHPDTLPISPPLLDSPVVSGISTPSSSHSLTCDPDSLHEVQVAESFGTNITTPSPESIPFSPPSQTTSNGKGKQREELPALPSLGFDKDDRVPTRVTGWDPDTSNDEPGPSFSRASTSISDSPPVLTATTSGLSRAFSQQRFEPLRAMQILSTESFISTSASISAFPSPIPSRPSSRPSSARSVSMNIKLKLKRSKEFLTGKRRHDGESSAMMTEKSTESLGHTLSTRPKIVSPLEPTIRPARSYTSPLPYSHLQSPPTPPVLTVRKHDFALGNAEDNDIDENKDAKPAPPNSFEGLLPIEIRLYIFRLLVKGFVDDLQMQVSSGHWSSAKAAETRWVGWEGGIRELVKISRVCHPSFMHRYRSIYLT